MSKHITVEVERVPQGDSYFQVQVIVTRLENERIYGTEKYTLGSYLRAEQANHIADWLEGVVVDRDNHPSPEFLCSILVYSHTLNEARRERLKGYLGAKADD